MQKDEQVPNLILSLSFLFCREKDTPGYSRDWVIPNVYASPITEYAVAYTSAVV